MSSTDRFSTDKEAMGLAIRLARTEQGMSRKKLSELAGVSYPFLSAIEAGTRRPSTPTLAGIARALGVSASALVEAAEARADLAEDRPSLERAMADADEPMLMAYSVAPDAMSAPSGPRRGQGRRTALLRELAALSEDLETEDLAFVVELVRRLAR